MDKLCEDCTKLLEFWADNSFLTYGEINVLLFIILQPLLILIYFIFTMILGYTDNKKLKTTIVCISIIIMIGCALGTYVLIAPAIMPMAWEFANS